MREGKVSHHFFLNKRGNRAVSQLRNWFSFQGAVQLGTHQKRGQMCVEGRGAGEGEGRGAGQGEGRGGGTCQVFMCLLSPERSGQRPKLPPCCARRKHSTNAGPLISPHRRTRACTHTRGPSLPGSQDRPIFPNNG